ncbi:hypothetical protein FOQG_18842 [Fusarium oxysporum f. sp. raphani 54005]|uniref:Uncharacterized protein n=2 Tax=Fusarium oxysporum f. sp. raphani TaxID=96318 RepID=X0BD36_FUSOX|nr:hypothetical protein FOQG_18842 [Fusarium oxysporum f. sp. raphani 54005]KAG7420603.1 hypothetical protein Forpi1262_v016365 [Fusarium oxysporum f. sp. raphani]
MSEDLFRVCVVRPPLAPNPRYPPIPLAEDSAFQVALGSAVSTNPEDPREGLEGAAAQYASSAEFAAPAQREPNNIKLDRSAEAIEELIDPAASSPPTTGGTSTPRVDGDGATHENLVNALKEALETDDLGSLSEWLDPLEERLKDSIVALRLLGIEQETGNLSLLTRRLRTIEVVRKVVADSNFPFNENDLRKYFFRPLLAPTFAELKSILSTANERKKAAAEAEASRKAAQERAKSLFKQRYRLTNTLKNLASLPASFQRTIEPKPFKPKPPKVDLSHTTLANEHLKLVQHLASLTVKSFENSLEKSAHLGVPPAGQPTGASLDTTPKAVAAEDLASFSAIANPLVNMSNTLLESLKQVPRQPRPTPALSMEPLMPFSLEPRALQQLHGDDLELLKELDVDITETPIDSTLHQLQQQLDSNATALDAVFEPYTARIAKVQTVGGLLVQYNRSIGRVWGDIFRENLQTPDELIRIRPRSWFPKPPGKVNILGVADLIVVKQQLVRYEGGDVAHIENVLKGETKIREISTLTSREIEITSEIETTTSKEQEATTAERFEVSHESDRTIKEESSAKAGVTVSASYGPTVSVSANASFSSDRSKSEAIKEAGRYSKDITTKATEKIAERVLERSVTRTRSETTTKDVHTLANTGAAHIAGVYQWLNKVYEAQMWNYGKRTMLDFMIPEPGAFYLDKQTDPDGPSDILLMVAEFKKTPTQLDASNYVSYGVEYGVTNLEAPPAEMSRTTASYAAGKDQPHSSSGKMTIMAGYEVSGITITASGVANIETGENWVQVTCGSFPWLWDPEVEPVGRITRTTKFIGFTVSKDITIIKGQTDQGDIVIARPEHVQREQAEIAWSVTASYMDHFCVTIELVLKRTDEAFSIWQHKTWGAIKAASDKLIKEKKEAMERAKFNSSFQGRNPEKNKMIIRDEMKKNCISILTDNHFDEFEAIKTSRTKAYPGGLAISEIDTERAGGQGAYVRFFEQAFEWAEMTWILYPYFWGRKDRWYRRVDYEDEDPEFEKFIQAGFARANVPVRPGFEGALEHYLATGQVWMGGPLPGISSSIFLPLAAEIQESLGKKSDIPVKYGEPWEVKVPTNLIRLRKDDKAPVWTKHTETQEWTEVPDAE